MSFKFRLQSIQELRQRTLEDCVTRLEQYKQMKAQLERLLIEQRDLYFQERDSLNECKRNGEFSKISIFELSLEARKGRMMNVLEHIRSVEVDIEVAEQSVISAKRDVTVIDNLREKKFKEYAAAELVKEQKEIDEIARNRKLRQDREDKKVGDS